MKRLVVTVGIPTWNSERTIRKCLESVINQTRKPDEIVICDESEDSTPDIIREISKKTDIPIKVIKQRRTGCGEARQRILEAAKGDIIAWIDSDLYAPQDWIEKRVRFHENHPDVDIVNGEYPPIKGHSKEVIYPTDFIDTRFFVQPACSGKREVFLSVGGYDARFLREEDLDMRVRLWRARVKSAYSADFYLYRQEASSPKELTKGLRSAYFFELLSKYGTWYIKLNPYHLLGTAARMSLPLLLLLSLISIFLNWKIAILFGLLFLLCSFLIILGRSYIIYRSTGRVPFHQWGIWKLGQNLVIGMVLYARLLALLSRMLSRRAD